MSTRFRCSPTALEEELMSKDKQRREAKKPKKKAPKADPAARRTARRCQDRPAAAALSRRTAGPGRA